MARTQHSARYFVKSLERALAVLRSFDAKNPTMTLSEVARRADITRASARRILLSLVDLGYAEQTDAKFGLRPRVLELGYAYLDSLGLAHRGQRALEALTAAINQPCSMSVLDGHDIVYVARSAVSRFVMVSVGVGTRLPAHATAMGRVLLADLSPADLDRYFKTAKLAKFTPKTVTDEAKLRRLLREIRDRDCAYVRDELEIGMEALAVPVRDSHGRTLAAISVYTAHVPQDTVFKSYLPKLQAVAKEIVAPS